MDRLWLHDELLKFSPNVYFQPPSNLQMIHPCIVYSKTGKTRRFGNGKLYFIKQQYQITVIDRSPTSTIPDEMESYFEYCSITQYYTVNGLNHTTLNIYI